MKTRKLTIALALAGIVGVVAASSAGGGFPAQPENPKLGDLVFFAANDPDHGYELWKSDGTKPGTKRVADINDGLGDSSVPDDFARVGKVVVFSANDGFDPGKHGEELWRTDGTKQGTKMVRDIYPGEDGSEPDYLTRIGKWVYFNAEDEDHGAELWRTDGTRKGTKLVKDIHPGVDNSFPQGFAKLGKFIYFGADDEDAGYELFRTDGTKRGTKLFKSIYPGNDGGSPHSLIKLGDRLYFSAETPKDGVELWRTDGTKAGTKQVKDINPAGDSFPSDFARLGDVLLFNAETDDDGSELWRTDGTKTGTKQVKDINPGDGESSDPEDLRRLGKRIVFGANDGSDEHGLEPWITDGTGNGTKLLKDIRPGTDSSVSCGFTPLGGELLFGAGEDQHGYELWHTDGTKNGTKLLKDILLGGAQSGNPFFCK